ncbi:MAG: hypothetical protein QXF12_04315, partial [Candidatus Aenigmatarchaeota archaeon]
MILCSKRSLPSAKVLRDCMYEVSEFMYYFIVSSFPKKSSIKIHVRWGNSTEFQNIDLKINPPDFIRIASNKLLTSRFLKSMSIPVVEFYPYHVIPDHYPVFIRHTLTGYKGIGIEIAENKDEFLEKVNRSYWSYGINSVEEFRFHYVLGEVVKIQ